MMKAEERIERLLSEIEEKCLASDYDLCRVPFMLDCASLIQGGMPSRAVQALETARAYSVHELPVASVDEAIEGCWRDIGPCSVSGYSFNADECALRALICILREQAQPGVDDFYELLSFFLDMLNRVEPHAEEQIVLIKKHFSHCLER
jgi:hypothetical protein